jgi:CheY-like chemotaxis protein
MRYELILLIDDNENTLYINEDIVTDYFENVSIKSFNNPAKFLSTFAELKSEFDKRWLIVLDLNMPEFDGYELLERLEESTHDIKNIDVIILTSSNQKSDIEKSKVFPNIISYIDKPLTEEKLKNSLLNKD